MGAFSVNGAAGDGADILRCAALVAGSNTSYVYNIFLDGAAIGIGSEVIDALLVSDSPAGGHTVQVAGQTSPDESDQVDDVDQENPDQESIFLPFITN
ncbi:MAG: hypothetical protein R2911_34555 [Caldilineaceae bacterium]